MKVVCKKTYQLLNRSILFTEGKTYNIINKTEGSYNIECNYPEIYGSLIFSIDNRIYDSYNFSRYFYSVSETRKIKLEKLNESTL